MKTVFLDIKDKVLCQTFAEIMKDFGFEVVGKNTADFVLKDAKNKIILNDETVFLKPVDVFNLVKSLGVDENICVGEFSLNLKKKQIKFLENVASVTDIEAKILEILMKKSDGIDAEDLSVEIFSKSNESCLKSLSTHIYNLKKKIESLTGKKKNIVLEKARYFLDL